MKIFWNPGRWANLRDKSQLYPNLLSPPTLREPSEIHSVLQLSPPQKTLVRWAAYSLKQQILGHLTASPSWVHPCTLSFWVDVADTQAGSPPWELWKVRGWKELMRSPPHHLMLATREATVQQAGPKSGPWKVLAWSPHTYHCH